MLGWSPMSLSLPRPVSCSAAHFAGAFKPLARSSITAFLSSIRRCPTDWSSMRWCSGGDTHISAYDGRCLVLWQLFRKCSAACHNQYRVARSSTRYARPCKEKADPYTLLNISQYLTKYVHQLEWGRLCITGCMHEQVAGLVDRQEIGLTCLLLVV